MAGSVIKEKLISLHGIEILVQYKLVKNITLRVKADGRAQLSVPYAISDRFLHEFLSEKEAWLRSKLTQRASQPRQHYIMGEVPFDGEHIWLWGKKMQCKFSVATQAKVDFLLKENYLQFTVPHELTDTQKLQLIEAWYKHQVCEEGRKFLDSWQQKMGVHYTGLKVHTMKTRWGSCNVRSGSINLNALLACWPKECLEYIVVHELTHLLEANHSPRFHALVGKFLPMWRERKKILESFEPR